MTPAGPADMPIAERCCNSWGKLSRYEECCRKAGVRHQALSRSLRRHERGDLGVRGNVEQFPLLDYALADEHWIDSVSSTWQGAPAGHPFVKVDLAAGQSAPRRPQKKWRPLDWQMARDQAEESIGSDYKPNDLEGLLTLAKNSMQATRDPRPCSRRRKDRAPRQGRDMWRRAAALPQRRGYVLREEARELLKLHIQVAETHKLGKLAARGAWHGQVLALKPIKSASIQTAEGDDWLRTGRRERQRADDDLGDVLDRA